MARSFSLFKVNTELPQQHHVVRLFPNYPKDPNPDPGHLILSISQRTTGAGQGIRLSRAELVGLAAWLASEPAIPADDVYQVAQIRATRLVDTFLAAWTNGDGVLLVVTHRAADYPQTRAARISWEDAAELGEAIRVWDACQPGGASARLRPARGVVDVHLPD